MFGQNVTGAVRPESGRNARRNSLRNGRRPWGEQGAPASRQHVQERAALRAFEARCRDLGLAELERRGAGRRRELALTVAELRRIGRRQLAAERAASMGGTTMLARVRAGAVRPWLAPAERARVLALVPTCPSAPKLHRRALDVVAVLASAELRCRTAGLTVRHRDLAELLSLCGVRTGERTAGTAIRSAVELGLVERVEWFEVIEERGKVLGHLRGASVYRLSAFVRAVLSGPGETCQASDSPRLRRVSGDGGGVPPEDGRDVDSPEAPEGEGWRAELPTRVQAHVAKRLRSEVERVEAEAGARVHAVHERLMAAHVERAARVPAPAPAPDPDGVETWARALVRAGLAVDPADATRTIRGLTCDPARAARGTCCGAHDVRRALGAAS